MQRQNGCSRRLTQVAATNVILQPFCVRIMTADRISLPAMRRCLFFATAKRLNRTGVSNAEQAWAYAELFAPTIGLGTTIAGFIQTCGIAGYQPLLDLVGVPHKFKIFAAL